MAIRRKTGTPDRGHLKITKGHSLRAKTVHVVLYLLAVALVALGCLAEEPGEPESVKPPGDTDISLMVTQIIDEVLKLTPLTERELIFSVGHSTDSAIVTLTGETNNEAVKTQIIDRILLTQGVGVVDKIVVLPAPPLDETPWGIVTCPVANLGDAPGKSGDDHTVTQARLGDIVRILYQEDDWYMVQMADNYLGWISPDCLLLGDKSMVDEFFKGSVAMIKSKMAVAVDGPDGNELFDKRLVQGSVLPVSAAKGDWVVLGLPGGRTAYVKGAYVKQYASLDQVFAQQKGAGSVIEDAKQYLGLPYLWGGCTSYGFDCSGFTQFIFKLNGYHLRRDADLQYMQGDSITTQAALAPGDLVFFQTYRKGASHVGIYIGESRFIHSGSGGVAINSFDPCHEDYSASLSQKYLGARRVIKQK